MDALRAPLDGIRRRLYREIAARRAIPASEVDAARVRRFWSSLSPASRLDVLRFTDATIVQRVHGYMITLLKADIWSRMNEVSSASDVTPRLSGFEFEAPAERDCLGSLRAPIAMLATEEFAVDDNLLDTVEKELGSQLLEGRPVLLRKDWSTVFDTAPSCWEDLQQQLYRLVELAIFHAERDPYFQLLSESGQGPEQEAVPSRRGGRRKAKKVIGTTGAAAQRTSAAQKQDTTPANAPEATDQHAEQAQSAQSSQEAEEVEPEQEEDQQQSDGEATGVPEASEASNGPPPEYEEETLLQKQPAASKEPDASAAKPARAENRPGSISAVLERQRLHRPSQSSEPITCFQWLPDLFQDPPHHHLQLMQFRKQAHGIREAETPVARAVVKNTFVEVQVLDEPDAKDAALRRSASAAAALNR